MYESYWGLTTKPFRNTPDPRFLYLSPQHKEVLMRLLYVVQERVGAAMLTGIFGSGKTVLATALLGELSPEKYRIAYVANPRLDDVDLLRMIAYQLVKQEPPLRKTDVLNLLSEFFIENLRNGKETVVIVDEAHSIENAAVLEELRLLLNFQLEDQFLLTLLLLGQPELKAKIDRNIPLEQRLSLKCTLGNLNQEETRNYVTHRLQVASRQDPVFTDEALELIFSYSGGLPRRINRLCDICLVSGFGRKVETIGKEIVQEEIHGLE